MVSNGHCQSSKDSRRPILRLPVSAPFHHKFPWAVGIVDPELSVWPGIRLGDFNGHPILSQFSASGKAIAGGYTDCIIDMFMHYILNR
jgi:hypothetical protein